MKFSWFTSPVFHKWALVVLAVVAIAEGVVAVFTRDNDFAVHRAQGKGFLEGRPYKYAKANTYPVPRLMFNGGLALLPNYVARASVYLLALLALVATFRMWSRLAEGQGATTPGVNLTAGLGVTFLFLPYLLRDLDECGLQIILLFFLTAAAYALWRKQPLWTGFWIATGIAFKVSPLLFAPFLIWKRQWRAAIYTVAFVGFWALIPAVFIGMETTIKSHQSWLDRVSQVGGQRQAYPCIPGLEDAKQQNLCLMATFARYLETYPEGHSLHLQHPWFKQFGNLDSESAYLAVRGILLGLGLFLAWNWRRGWTAQNMTADLPSEWACVTMLVALLAPQCWKQHMIVIFPAAFLVLRQQLLAQSRFPWRLGILLLFGAAAIGTRQFFLGRELSIVAMSYKLDSFGSLALLMLTVFLPRSQASVAGLSLGRVPGFRRAA